MELFAADKGVAEEVEDVEVGGREEEEEDEDEEDDCAGRLGFAGVEVVDWLALDFAAELEVVDWLTLGFCADAGAVLEGGEVEEEEEGFVGGLGVEEEGVGGALVEEEGMEEGVEEGLGRSLSEEVRLEARELFSSSIFSPLSLSSFSGLGGSPLYSSFVTILALAACNCAKYL